MNLTLWTKKVLQTYGFQLRRTPKVRSGRSASLHLDAFHDQEFLLREIPVTTIFDVGAHIGETAMQYAKLFQQATIFSFEPLPASYASLSEACKSMNQVKPNNVAVAESSGPQTLFITNASPLNSLFPLSEESRDYYDEAKPDRVKPVQVNCVCLDDFCKAQNVDRINICKLDVQGGELLALKGATGLLQKGRIDLIYLEVSFANIYNGQAQFYQICEFLIAQRYSLFGLYNLYHGKANGNLVQADAIFINDSLFTALPSVL